MTEPVLAPALTQGLLRCAICGESLIVCYRKNTYSYGCALKWLKYAETPCTRFVSNEFDQYVLREVFNVLGTPPLDMLRSALEAARSQEQARLSLIEFERDRLQHGQRKAQELVNQSYGSHPQVYRHAMDQLQKILNEKQQFEEETAAKLTAAKPCEPNQELEELCRLRAMYRGYGTTPLSHITRERKFCVA